MTTPIGFTQKENLSLVLFYRLLFKISFNKPPILLDSTSVFYLFIFIPILNKKQPFKVLIKAHTKNNIGFNFRELKTKLHTRL